MERLAVLWKRNPTLGSCPSCNSYNTLKKSHSRNSKEKFINRTGIYHTFRCSKCGWRGYLSTLSLTLHSLRAMAIYFIILLVTVLITYQVIKRIF
ncbi:MAG: hypothetical protein N3D80_00235 [Ignavibacterium album]|jgi:hypothetical protein|uniref:Uncharacterized protein n=1 Tax=Ignavibacterium album TaxID=591197 RepID=A0A7V2ZK70_9BACT|nr:hypothetical protein [Ignavibacterium album]MCX8104282.1 hypothetical protein [Ignavibacterium album]